MCVCVCVRVYSFSKFSHLDAECETPYVELMQIRRYALAHREGFAEILFWMPVSNI